MGSAGKADKARYHILKPLGVLVNDIIQTVRTYDDNSSRTLINRNGRGTERAKGLLLLF